MFVQLLVIPQLLVDSASTNARSMLPNLSDLSTNSRQSCMLWSDCQTTARDARDSLNPFRRCGVTRRSSRNTLAVFRTAV